MILVTGGTGLIGSEVLRLLSQAGVAARALTRNPQKAKTVSGITWVAGDLAKPDTLTAAFRGAKTLFLNSAISEDLVALQNNGVAAARAVGVQQLRFVDETPEQSRARRQREGYPPKIIESALAISAYQRAGGKTETITSVVTDLTGRPPRTFAEFAREHAAVFRG